jgi:hypothetical protein
MQDWIKPNFAGAEWAGLTVAERVTQCHAHAREAMQLADASHPDMGDTSRDIAAQWHTLAAEIEEAGRDAP